MVTKSYRRTTTVRTTNRIEITAEDIRVAFGLPDQAKIKFGVPGGGDWSNMQIDVDEDTPVIATWTVVAETEE